MKSLPYAARAQMDPGELASFTSRGGRFRSRPGAPMATPPSGLTSNFTGALPSTTDRLERDASWGKTFGTNSVYGGRMEAEGEAVRERNLQRTESAVSRGEAIPEMEKFNAAPRGTAANPLPLSPIERQSLAARAGRPLKSYPQPVTADQPDAVVGSTVAELEKWHNDNGIPLPQRTPRAGERDTTTFSPDYKDATRRIESKYGFAQITTRLRSLNANG